MDNFIWPPEWDYPIRWKEKKKNEIDESIG